MNNEIINKQINDQKGVMRTLTLNQIQIKNVDKWDGVKAQDFVGQGEGIGGDQKQKSQDMTINEEVKTTEYAPAIFAALRKMDNITDEMI